MPINTAVTGPLAVLNHKLDDHPCEVHFLNPTHLNAILGLQALVREDLEKREQSHFIVPKTHDEFAHFLGELGQMVGVFHQGDLVGQAIFAMPTAENPDTGTAMRLPSPVNQLSVLRGMLVHPRFRGNHFMQQLCALWKKLALENKRRHLIAEIAVDNPYSWSVLLEVGMHIVQAGIDPTDDCRLYYAHGLADGLIATEEVRVELRPMLEFPQQQELLRLGFVGCTFRYGLLGLALRKDYKV